MPLFLSSRSDSPLFREARNSRLHLPVNRIVLFSRFSGAALVDSEDGLDWSEGPLLLGLDGSDPPVAWVGRYA